MPVDSKQYDSAMHVIDDAEFTQLISNLSSDDDRKRLMSYELYEDMYHNRPEHIRISVRGEEDDDDSIEIYLPSAKKNVEAVKRFLAKNYQVIPDPNTQPSDNAIEVGLSLENLFKRERFKSKFNNFVRYGLIKGDALFHIQGDDTKRPGKRLSILELKPEHYFPIEHPVTGNMLGCYIVDIIKNPRNSPATWAHRSDMVVRRQTYLKVYSEDPEDPVRIMSDLALYELGAWDERVLPKKDIHKIEQIRDPFILPDGINQLPVYHWKNNAPTGSTFGMSQLAGSETIVNAINQSISDEDLTLIMQGLGVYWTDAAPPMDNNGDEVEWEISPRSVVQVASGGQFGRVSGISSIQPFGDHINKLEEAMQQAIGVPDLAVGIVDATIAESGIALALKFGPLISQNAEKELDLIDISDQLIYDLVSGWLPAYEGIDSEGVVFVSKFDDPMPRNKSKELADLMQIWNAASTVLPIDWFYNQLNDIMGYELDFQKDFPAALEQAQMVVESQQPPLPPEPPPDSGDGGNNSVDNSKPDKQKANA